MNPDPRDDQAEARRHDLARFFELAKPHMTGTEVPEDLLGRMNDADKAEALAILGRLDLGTSTEEERERRKVLLGLAQVEAEFREILAKGNPRMRNGKMLRDPQTGEILRNRNTDRSVRASLRKLEQLRSQITGLPLAD